MNNNRNITKTTQILVIGAGSGGLTSAIGLAKVGYKVLLVEKHLIGGDCTNYGCIPSKSLLYKSKKIADFKKQAKENNIKLELDDLNKINLQPLIETKKVVQKFQNHESPDWLKSLGVEFMFGQAKFISKNQVKIINPKNSDETDIIVNFKKAIIATGSSAFIPTIEGLLGTPFLTNQNIFSLKSIPETLTIIGNGPIGIEIAVSFNNLGTKVIVIGRKDHILERSEISLTTDLKKHLIKEGIQFLTENTKKIEYDDKSCFKITFDNNKILQTEELLIATGRKPNLDLDLNKAGINSEINGIIINQFARTSNRNIYAIGDCVLDMPKFTHFADYMGKVVVTNLTLQKYLKIPLHISSVDIEKNPAVTYTSPELAQIGFTEKEARQRFNNIKTFEFDLSQVDRIKATDGFGKIIFVTKGLWARIIGVHILAERAGEILPEFQYLVLDKKNIKDINKIIRSYPTYTSGIGSVVINWLVNIFKK